MTKKATQAKNSRSFAEQSVFVSSIPSSMYDAMIVFSFLIEETCKLHECNYDLCNLNLIVSWRLLLDFLEK